jgi:drug/metabolite transporter (DMT)-like permease
VIRAIGRGNSWAESGRPTQPDRATRGRNPGDSRPQLVGALAWSVLVLTGGGISLLFLMLRRGAAAQVTSYFYLVPGITALMALVMFHETLGPIAIAGMVVGVLGVALATRANGSARADSP